VREERFHSGWPAPLKALFLPFLPEERHITLAELVDDLDRAVRFPGLTNAWTMPIKTRIDMLSTGIKTPVGIKIMGPDLDQLARLGESIEGVVKGLPGTLSVVAERVTGGNYLDVELDREAIARYGLLVQDVQETLQTALGGMNVTYTVEGLERYPVNLRYRRELRDSVDEIRRMLIAAPSGYQVPLAQVADIRITRGPGGIKSENAKRTAWVFVDIRDRDIGSYVTRAKQAVEEQVPLPEGYSLIWSGQYEYMEKARRTLNLIVPATLMVIFILLYLHFRNIPEVMIVMGSLPFALIGGIWLIFALDYNLSIAVVVGFIALAGLAAETGIVMLVYLDEACRGKREQGGMATPEDLRAAVIEGAVERVRPKLMTVATTLVGLLPVMAGAGTGSEIMKRIAAPMVGGLVSSTVLTLVVIPVVYTLWRQRQLKGP
jgi:Cu(I)/Ag(I) efflux system membrane protein CusA/SilA